MNLTLTLTLTLTLIDPNSRSEELAPRFSYMLCYAMLVFHIPYLMTQSHNEPLYDASTKVLSGLWLTLLSREHHRYHPVSLHRRLISMMQLQGQRMSPPRNTCSIHRSRGS